MNRKPPKKILDILRSEVNFGCPICGNPYLTWHHFNPPWHVENHHNPEGMIALCQEHHSKADAGAFTKEQLINLKRPSKDRITKGEFNWFRNKLALKLGSNWYYNVNTIITINNTKFLWFSRDSDNNLLINLVLPTTNGKLVYVIKDNWWYKFGNPKNIICPPSGKKIEIKYSNGNYVKLNFNEYLNESDLEKSFKDLPNEIINKENETIKILKENPLMKDLDWPEQILIQYPLTVLTIDIFVKNTPLVFTSSKDSSPAKNSLFINLESAITFNDNVT